MPTNYESPIEKEVKQKTDAMNSALEHYRNSMASLKQSDSHLHSIVVTIYSMHDSYDSESLYKQLHDGLLYADGRNLSDSIQATFLLTVENLFNYLFADTQRKLALLAEVSPNAVDHARNYIVELMERDQLRNVPITLFRALSAKMKYESLSGVEL